MPVVCLCIPALGANVTLNPGDNLQAAIDSATAGSVITLNAGTYNLSQKVLINKSLTVQGAGGALPNVVVPSGAVVAAELGASNIRLERLRISGTNWGIYAGDGTGAVAYNGIQIVNVTVGTTPSTTIPGHGIFVRKVTNAVVQNCTVETAQVNGILIDEGSSNATLTGNTVVTTVAEDSAIKISASDGAQLIGNIVQNTGSGAHGILLTNAKNAIIDGNTVNSAFANGILLDNNSDTATVINNTVNATVEQHGIAVKNSNSAIVAGNNILGSAFHGILLIGSSYSRVERNSVTGHKYDGITVTKENMGSQRTSIGTYVGRNFISSPWYANGGTTGTGIWINWESSGALVFGNRTSGAPENGLTIFNASKAEFRGNTTSANGEGGIFIYGPGRLVNGSNQEYTNGAQPANVYLTGNYAFDLPRNAGINLRQASNVAAIRNFVKGQGLATQAGMLLQSTQNNFLYGNTFRDVKIGVQAFSDVTSNSYCRNRHLNAIEHHATTPATIAFDCSDYLGGNFWSNHNGIGPFEGVIYTPAGNTGGPYVDRYPFPSDNVGETPAVSQVLQPVAGRSLAAGSQKTIQWLSRGCTYVDLSVNNTPIVSDYPDVGFYQWTVPNAVGAATVRVECKNSAATSFGVSATSESFNIRKAGLELLSPHGHHRVTANGSTVVSWKRGAGVADAVNVLYRASSGGAYTTLASNVTGNAVSVTAPATLSPDAEFAIQSASDAAMMDSTDGQIAAITASPTASLDAVTQRVGQMGALRWTSMAGSLYIDIAAFVPATNSFQTVLSDLPDFGSAVLMTSASLIGTSRYRITFKNDSGALGSVETSDFTATRVTKFATAGTVSTPSASGVGTVFTATFSGTSGGADIERAAILINASLRAVNGCEVEYQRATNTLRLRDNLALTWIGPVAVGSGSLANSQCTVNSAASSRSFSGATLTLNLNIAFSSSFNGAKTIYLNVSDTANLVDGWKAAGSYTVGTAAPAVPANVSVSPASGSGTTQTFTAVYSDANGGGDIALAHLLVNGSVSGTAACFVEFNRPGNTLRLMNDAGNTWLGPITPGSGSLSNSQCSLTGSGSGGSVSGNNLTVTYAITFKTNFSGSKNLYLLPIDNGGQPGSWQSKGTWTVGAAVPSGPAVSTFSPLSGAASSGTFTATFTHSGGASQHYLGYILLLPTPNVVNYTATGSCLIEYNRISNGVRLIDNAGTGWLGGQSGIPISPSAGALQNAQCSVNVAQVVASVNGTTMTVSAPVTFKSGLGGVLGTFLQSLDVNGVWTGMTQFGNWVAPGTNTRPGPMVAGLSPSSGAGKSAVLTVSASHPGGALAQLQMVHVLVSDRIVGGTPCQVVYVPSVNLMNLINDAGTDMSGAWVGPGGGTVANSRCTLTGSSMVRATSNQGQTVTITIPISFNAATFAGAKKIYVNAFDNSGLLSHWVQGGTWTVQ